MILLIPLDPVQRLVLKPVKPDAGTDADSVASRRARARIDAGNKVDWRHGCVDTAFAASVSVIPRGTAVGHSAKIRDAR